MRFSLNLQHITGSLIALSKCFPHLPEAHKNDFNLFPFSVTIGVIIHVISGLKKQINLDGKCVPYT